jgi:hypothetical protein
MSFNDSINLTIDTKNSNNQNILIKLNEELSNRIVLHKKYGGFDSNKNYVISPLQSQHIFSHFFILFRNWKNENFNNNYNNLVNKYKSFDELELDELGVNSTFQITTMEDEQTSIEDAEKIILESLDNLNLSLKSKNKNMFFENLFQFSKNIVNSEKNNSNFLKNQIDFQLKKEDNNNNIENNNFKNNKETNKNIIKEKLKRSKTFDTLNEIEENYFEKENINQNENIYSYIQSNNFLSQNIDYTDETLKFLVMGSENCGKSYFISKLFMENNNIHEKMSPKFSSFEIRKKNIKLLGHYIKLELLDTQSSLSKTQMLNVYFKICDGMISIIDYEKVKSAEFILDLYEKKKYEIDINYKNNIILCIKNNINKIENNNKNNLIVKILKKIEDNYDTKINFINFDNISHFHNIMNKYFSITYLKKDIFNIKRKKKKNKRERVSTMNL